MLCFLNKIIRDNFLKKSLKSAGGQVAIILILVIAAALIFFAVTLNLTKLSTSRTLVTIASNTSASMMASSMASYGQFLSETYLKGKDKLCAYTSVLQMIIIAIVVIIAAILTVVTYGLSLALVVGVVLALGAVVIQIVVVQPAITEAWNRQKQKTMSMEDRFVEDAIQGGLMKVVSDMVMVDDVNDSDFDGRWTGNTAPGEELVSRFAMYYSRRLSGIAGHLYAEEIGDFVTALGEFLYEGDDGWGLNDPVFRGGCIEKAECNPCCLPNTLTMDGETITDIRSTDDCENSTDDVYWTAKCGAESPYGVTYPWIYDGSYDNPDNTFFSLRELIGRDDEHVDYYKDENDPGSNPVAMAGPGRFSQILHFPGEEGFRLEDTTGFYGEPYYSPTYPDNKKGIYPFFHKMADWGVDLGTVGDDFGVNPSSRECHWCDVRDAVNCIPCVGLPPHPHPLEIPQIVLPLDPAVATDGLIYNTTYFVDGFDPAATPSTDPPLAVDKITLVPPGNVIANPDVCAQDTVYPPPGTADGFWKPGGDRYCSTDPGYHLECPKHSGACSDPSHCLCSEVNAAEKENFPDDVLDDIVYGLPDFISWAKDVFRQADANINVFMGEFKNWYETMALWIEPASPPANKNSNPPCFLCDLRIIPEGGLYIWLKEMTGMRDRLLGWINNHDPGTGVDQGYTGTTCTEAWCIPDAGLACPQVDHYEAATFDSNVNGVDGDVEDIVACLNYNIHGYDHVANEAFNRCLTGCGAINCGVGAAEALPESQLDGTSYEYPATPLNCVGWGPGNEWYDAVSKSLALAVKPQTMMQGNDVRFENCANTCSLADCHYLPRSLVPFDNPPDYNPLDYQPLDPLITADGNWIELRAFNDCLDNCSEENCRVGPRLPVANIATAVPYVYPGLNPTAADCAAWAPGNAWYDAVLANKLSIKPLDEADMAPMLRCFGDCTANIADCQAMPDIQTSTGGPYPWPASPATFAAGNCAVWAPGNPWYDAIIANVLVAGGASCDLNANGWLDQTRQSAIEATNQVAKFQKRRDFLVARLAEIDNIFEVFGEDTDGDGITDTGAINKFEEFLTGPAAKLIEARVALDDYQTGLPFQAVYGWKDEDPSPAERGRWHIVKVEARMPGRCDYRCNESQDGRQSWPKVETETSNWGTKRCYTLENERGVVKFRAMRYDEDKASDLLRFPSGAPIWRRRSYHPLRPQTSGSDPTMLGGACDSSMITTHPRTTVPTDIYRGAFMMDKRYGPATLEDNSTCWDLAHEFLTMGVINDTCAQYYFHGSPNKGMGLKFIPCKDF